MESPLRTTSPLKRALTAVVAAAALVAGGLFVATPASAAPPLPTRMAALGDSITQASVTCTILILCPANSWSTGSTASVASHASRLKALGASTLTVYNDAVPSSSSSALQGQAARAVAQGAQYVTVEIGANDACTKNVGSMTPTATFAAYVQAALSTLAASSAKPEIFVASIPNLMRLWDINKTSIAARLAWALLGECDSMLAKPTSTAPADVQRRAAVQQRVNEFNAALQSVCGSTPKCRYDGGAVANYAFSKSEITTIDYFHPSLAGQKAFAALTWPTTQWVHP